MEYTTTENNYPLIRPLEYYNEHGAITQSFALFLNEQELVNFRSLQQAQDYALELIDSGRIDTCYILVDNELVYA